MESEKRETSPALVLCGCGVLTQDSGRATMRVDGGKYALFLWADEGHRTRVIGCEPVHWCPVCGKELSTCKVMGPEYTPPAVQAHLENLKVGRLSKEPSDSPRYEFMGDGDVEESAVITEL